MKHKRKERLFGRWLALLLLCLLWGGGLPADAAERAWAKYDEATKTLTFYCDEKGEPGNDVYEMNEGTQKPVGLSINPTSGGWCSTNRSPRSGLSLVIVGNV